MGKRQISQVFFHTWKGETQKSHENRNKTTLVGEDEEEDKRGNRMANECEQSIMIYMYENYLMKHSILHANKKY